MKFLFLLLNVWYSVTVFSKTEIRFEQKEEYSIKIELPKLSEGLILRPENMENQAFDGD